MTDWTAGDTVALLWGGGVAGFVLLYHVVCGGLPERLEARAWLGLVTVVVFWSWAALWLWRQPRPAGVYWTAATVNTLTAPWAWRYAVTRPAVVRWRARRAARLARVKWTGRP